MKKIIGMCLSLFVITLCFVGVQPVSASVYQSDYSNQVGNWKNMVGQGTQKINQKRLTVTNQKVGTNYENIALNLDAGSRKSGEVELSFVYNGQTNFGLVFRAGDQDSKNYQSFAYTRDGKWQLGQPGGKWITGIQGPALEKGKTYRLLVRYKNTSIQVYLNTKEIYNNPKVSYPNGSQIDGNWSGNVGYRLFGNLSQLDIISMRTGEVGELESAGEAPAVNPEQFELMRTKWRNQLVSDQYDTSNTSSAQYVKQLSETAGQLYQRMDKSAERSDLWAVKAGDTASAHVTTQFRNLYALAQAYGTKGTSLYHDPKVLNAIEGGLDFMVSKKGYDGIKTFGNWWDWQIGVTHNFVKTLIILKNELPKEKVAQYTKIIGAYVPNPYQQLTTKPQNKPGNLSFIANFSTTGANRTDLALVVLGLGILQDNGSLVKEASDSIKVVFKKVSKGDGFYADDSFIQHYSIPYTGSYGDVLIKGVGNILSVTKGSSYEMDAPTVNDFVTTVKNAFLPLINQGEMIPGVRGRSISRAPKETEVGFGSSTMYNLLIVSELAPEKEKNQLQEAVKYWMLENPNYYLNNTRDYHDLQMTLQLLSDQKISGSSLPFVGSKLFASMDRFVQSTPDYMASLSLYSNRIASFEAGNGENKRGWHTSDGMLYLYNNDGVQFGHSYWPTVDPYRLPGTTVDTVTLEDENSAFKTIKSSERWVGGVTDGNHSVIGMSLNKEGTKNNGNLLPMNLKAKKSWFILDGQIIALGAGITGTTKASIETIVDNRLLNDEHQYQMIENQNNWKLLQSSQAKESIGYYFPTGNKVSVTSEKRTGSYSEINSAFPSDKVYTANYQKLIIDHGQNPENADYAYVILPGATQTSMEKYAKDSQLNILSNTGDIQAVEVKDKQYLGINFWKSTGGSIAGISSDKSLSLMKQTKEGQTTYTFSDPTQSLGLVHVNLPKDFQQAVSMSEGVQYDQATNTLTIDFTKRLGASQQFITK